MMKSILISVFISGCTYPRPPDHCNQPTESTVGYFQMSAQYLGNVLPDSSKFLERALAQKICVEPAAFDCGPFSNSAGCTWTEFDQMWFVELNDRLVRTLPHELGHLYLDTIGAELLTHHSHDLYCVDNGACEASPLSNLEKTLRFMMLP